MLILMKKLLILHSQEAQYIQIFYLQQPPLKKNVNFLLEDKLIYFFKVNERKVKEPVALSCKWFTINKNNEVLEISGVVGAFYQPCADDIGMKYFKTK